MRVLLAVVSLLAIMLLTPPAAAVAVDGSNAHALHALVAASLPGLQAAGMSTRVSDACQDAASALAALFSAEECAVVFSGAETSIWREKDVGRLTSLVDAYCVSPCRAELGGVFSTFLGACERTELAELGFAAADIVNVRLALTLPCFAVGATRCYPAVVDFLNTFSANTVLTPPLLTDACTPCKRQYFLHAVTLSTTPAHAAAARATAGLFEFLCATASPPPPPTPPPTTPTYCILELERVQAFANPPPPRPPPPLTDLVTHVCATDCYARLAAVAAAYNVSSDARAGLRNAAAWCSRSDTGGLCLVSVLSALSSPAFAASCPATTCPSCVPADPFPASGCAAPRAPYCATDAGSEAQQAAGFCNTTMCAAPVAAFMAETGCCAATVLDLFPSPARVDSIAAWVSLPPPRGCGVAFNPRCTGEKVTITVAVANVNPLWAAANKPALLAAVAADVALATGLSPLLMTAAAPLGALSPVTITVSGADADTARAASFLLRQAATSSAGRILSPNTAALGEDAVANQDAGISLVAAGTACASCLPPSPTSPATPAATPLPPPLSLLLATLVLLLTHLAHP